MERPAGIGARQSKGNDISVEDQVTRGQDACEREGWPVHRVYRDRVSASRFGTKQRDEWPQLVADVAARALGVVVLWDVSRGDRKPAEWAAFVEQCRQTSTLVHLVRARRTYDVTTPEDWKTLLDLGTAAGYESEVRSADTRRGIAEAAVAGKPHGKPGFGYRREYDPANRKKFDDVPDANAPTAREIIERVAKRDPLNAIMLDLNRRGVPAPGGGLWFRRSVRQVATNVRYVGLRGHYDERHTAAWPAIVDEATFWRAQVVLGEKDRAASPPGQIKHLLSYLMRCSVCKQTLTPSASAKTRPQYRCAATGCLRVGAEAADKYVTLLVLERLSRPDAREVFAPSGKELAAAQAEVARLESELERARVAYEHHGDDDAFTRRVSRLRPELAAAQERLRGVHRSDAVLDLLGDGEFSGEVGRRRWDGLSVPARRTVLRGLFVHIECAPATWKLTARATDDQRLSQAAERITVAWRGESVG